MEKQEFTLKYEGTNELDVNMVIASLQNISNSLIEISKNTTGEDVQIHIKPFKEGSYEIIFSILSDPNVLAGAKLFYENIPGESVIEKFTSILDFIKQTKGKDISKAIENNGKYILTGDNGEVEIIEGSKVENYYQNQGAVVNIENLVIMVGANKKIDGIKLMDYENKELTNLPKDLIKIVSEGITKTRVEKADRKELISEDIPKTKAVPKENVVIAIVKPDLNGDTLWKVVFEGNEISVKVEDDKFKNNVNQGKYYFANGTLLLVDLVITQAYDSTIKVYKNKSYSLSKFHRIIEAGEQQDLFINN